MADAIRKIEVFQSGGVFDSRRYEYILNRSRISKEDFDANKDKVVDLCLQSGCTTMSPRVPGGEDFRKILDYAYEGKDIDF